MYSIGNISAPTFIGNLIGNTTGSANNASYLGGLPAVNYAQLLGATFTSLSVTNTIVGNINGSANNASYLGNISASGYQTALGFTPYNSTNPAGYITSTTANVISFNGKTGIVNLSSTDVDGALGYTPPSATGAGATGTWGISVTGSAASVTNAAQLAITSVGILTGLTSAGNISAPTFIGNVTGSVTGNVTGNITGSANNASYLGGSPAANYAQLLGATFTSLSVTNTIVGNINGNANNASYLGGSLAANYATLASPVFIGVPVLPSYTFNLLPTVVLGGIIFVSNAVGAHGNGSMCFGNATAWVDVTTGIAVV